MIGLTLFEDGHAILKAAIKVSQENSQFTSNLIHISGPRRCGDIWNLSFMPRIKFQFGKHMPRRIISSIRFVGFFFNKLRTQKLIDFAF